VAGARCRQGGDRARTARDRGFRIDARESLAGRRAALDRQGPAVALRLFLVAALTAVVLAVIAVATTIHITGRRRAYELAALRTLGVGRRTLVAAMTREQLTFLGAGIVLGAASGLAGAVLALPKLPTATGVAEGPPLVYTRPGCAGAGAARGEPRWSRWWARSRHACWCGRPYPTGFARCRRDGARVVDQCDGTSCTSTGSTATTSSRARGGPRGRAGGEPGLPGSLGDRQVHPRQPARRAAAAVAGAS
jgi:hypothetical protein